MGRITIASIWDHSEGSGVPPPPSNFPKLHPCRRKIGQNDYNLVTRPPIKILSTVALNFDETVMSNWLKREGLFFSSLFCRAVIFQNSCVTHETFYTFTQPHRTVREKGNEAAAKRCWWMVKKSNCARTILLTFFWGLFWGLFFIWRLFWRLFIQKIVAKLKIVPKIVFKQKMNLKITLWANSHQNSPGRCVHL